MKIDRSNVKPVVDNLRRWLTQGYLHLVLWNSADQNFVKSVTKEHSHG